MADSSDVSTALVAAVSQAVYPNGTGQASITGFPAVSYPGWPFPGVLDTDIRAGKNHISVYPRPEERNTTRFPMDWQTLSTTAATLTLGISGQTITVGGSIPNPIGTQNLTVVANGVPYVYAAQQADTLTSIATALAALIAVGIPGTTSSGAVITLPNSARLTAVRVGTSGTQVREIRRQEKVFQISVWADTNEKRVTLASAIDAALSSVNFLTMPDGTAARLIYRNSLDSDVAQKDRIYRRDIFYTVEYATTQTSVDTQVSQTQLNESTQVTGATANVSGPTSYN